MAKGTRKRTTVVVKRGRRRVVIPFLRRVAERAPLGPPDDSPYLGYAPTGEASRLSLAETILKPKSHFEGDRLQTRKGSQLLFQDHGASVLGVAHLDWVGEGRKGQGPPLLWKGGEQGIIAHPALDDRLGAWALLYLKREGVKFDLLFTDDEECGQSTGRDFEAPRQYNWLFMFDRAGTDCVCYQYDANRKWRDTIDEYLGPHAQGSYSCIRAMEHLGACGFNLGVGYRAHNSDHCWANLAETHSQMRRFVAFHKQFRNTPFPYEAPPPQRHTVTYASPYFGAGVVYGGADYWRGMDAQADSLKAQPTARITCAWCGAVYWGAGIDPLEFISIGEGQHLCDFCWDRMNARGGPLPPRLGPGKGGR